MEQFQKVRAEFRPKRIDDLQNGCELLIGHVMEWQAAWLIEDGEYEGDWAMSPLSPRPDGVQLAWAPLSDLQILPD